MWGSSSVGVLLSFASAKKRIDGVMEVERSCIISYCNGFPRLHGESPTGDEHSPSPQNDVIITKKNTAPLKILTHSEVRFVFATVMFQAFPRTNGESRVYRSADPGKLQLAKSLAFRAAKEAMLSDWTLPLALHLRRDSFYCVTTGLGRLDGRIDGGSMHTRNHIKANEIDLMEGEGGFASCFGRTRPLLGFELKVSGSQNLGQKMYQDRYPLIRGETDLFDTPERAFA
ncbi:hypothetical protein GE21DRAFT_1306207 [Neurospora crassa]|nr:hypothetical protein GE21DRAFT_1306207 [Neurospora crassa]